jgi:hypothetical protein
MTEHKPLFGGRKEMTDPIIMEKSTSPSPKECFMAKK